MSEQDIARGIEGRIPVERPQKRHERRLAERCELMHQAQQYRKQHPGKVKRGRECRREVRRQTCEGYVDLILAGQHHGVPQVHREVRGEGPVCPSRRVDLASRAVEGGRSEGKSDTRRETNQHPPYRQLP